MLVLRLPLDELPDDPRTEVAELPREEELDEPLTLVPVALPLDELLDDPRTEVAELPREEELDEPLTEPEEALPLDADEPERTLLLDDEPRDADDEYRNAFGL